MAIVLFDGICNFCNHSVQFIIHRDPHGYFQFASLQSEIGKKLIKDYNIPDDLNSLIVIEDNKYYVKSSAALRISKNLRGPWKIFYLFLIIPKPFRDMVYSFVANNRYQWFGKSESCQIPSSEIRKRFLE
ncbi:thiol-disulfide oxidoreductase DCC family protein [Anaerobacillus sp. MEB173]|uniref:thiol-disulfide oxidoreductase DCC family protein n=1 Tax=Anaerobacillus sp. MEB173 TaxID=3383345 RepID=UPI003F8FAF35